MNYARIHEVLPQIIKITDPKRPANILPEVFPGASRPPVAVMRLGAVRWLGEEIDEREEDEQAADRNPEDGFPSRYRAAMDPLEVKQP
jgi:hypothetical protein